MCGIAGVWSSYRPDVVAEMLARLRHRGPDACGLHAIEGQGSLGHTRLSIVDLHGGNQPLVQHDAVLVGNGEVYNAPDLRVELASDRVFGTGSDNEVILNLLAARGIDSAGELNGMFAFAMCVDDQLVLGRDALGIKPLYVGRLDDELVFCSELGGFPPGTTDVEALAPGTTWASRDGVHRFWQVPDPDPVPGDLAFHAGRVRAALEVAVRRQLMADVPVGAFLSGGLDSSALTAVLAQHVAELHTFSVGVAGSPDLIAAEKVAAHLGTTHHSYELTAEEILTELPGIVRSLESFDQDLVRSAIPCFFTARLAAQHLKVVLTGEGADELFAGYRYHKDIADPAALHADARRALAELHHVNLQRVDRLTMAHSLEARVPFLDVDLIETALSIPAALRMPSVGGLEKAVLRMAIEDLLPPDIAWRDKAQFDEGSGTADLMPELSECLDIDADAYRARYPDTMLRSAEECWYHQLLVASVPEPGVVLANVARWSDRDLA